jgi:hypothetical protein
MMSNRVLVRAFLPFIASIIVSIVVIVCCTYLASGATRLTLASLGEGERVALDVATSVNSGQSSTDPNALLSIVRHGTNLAVQIDRKNAAGETYSGWWQKDGTLGLQLADKNDATPLEVRDFNLVAGALAGAPAEPKLNDTWKANLDVPFAETQTVRIATNVTVIAVTPDGIELQAIGRGRATLNSGRGGRGGRGLGIAGSAPGSTFPSRRGGGGFDRSRAATIDVAVNFDSHFAAGNLVAAKGTIQTTSEGQDHPNAGVSWTLAPHR